MTRYLIVVNRGWASEVQFELEARSSGDALRTVIEKNWYTPNTVSIEATELR